MANFLGQLLDLAGTAVGAPELGWSENFGGGATANTGRVPITTNNYANSPASRASYANYAGQGGVVPVATGLAGGLGGSLGLSGVLGATSTGTSSGGGTTSRVGAAAAPSYDPAALAYYDDQINQANSALGRINTQREVGLGNILGSYNGALNTLTGQNSQAERNAGLTRQRSIDDNVNARAAVDANVSRQSQSLRRLLGNSSSAAQFAAPLAVARQGNQQQGEIQTSYGRNLQNLDIADEDRKRSYEAALSDLNNQRTQSENTLNSGLMQNEAQINETLSGLALQRAQARGQNYTQARGASQGYSDRITNLLNQIDQLGRNPAITAREVAYTAPSLEQYATSPIAAQLGQQSAAQNAAGQYGYLLGDERRRREVI